MKYGDCECVSPKVCTLMNRCLVTIKDTKPIEDNLMTKGIVLHGLIWKAEEE
jgi:hypothetical protein